MVQTTRSARLAAQREKQEQAKQQARLATAMKCASRKRSQPESELDQQARRLLTDVIHSPPDSPVARAFRPVAQQYPTTLGQQDPQAATSAVAALGSVTILTAVNQLQEQLTAMQAQMAAQQASAKPIPSVPNLTDPALLAVAEAAVESLRDHPEEGASRDKQEACKALLRACVVLDKFNIDSMAFTKGSVVRDVAEIILKDPKLADSVLQTHALNIAYSKGLVKPNHGSALMALQLQMGAQGLGGFAGAAGLGSGLQAHGLGFNPSSAGMPALGTSMHGINPAAPALGTNPLVPAGLGLGGLAGSQLAVQLLQAPMVPHAMFPGQLGVQQMGMPVVMPGMAASYGAEVKFKKPVQCYHCSSGVTMPTTVQKKARFWGKCSATGTHVSPAAFGGGL